MNQDATIAERHTPTQERGGDSCPASCSPSRIHLDLFSGIGGFALAAQWTGWQTTAFAEIDPYATKILKRHWPTVPNLGDIRNVRNIRCDLITGGFPCQPYSLAGKRAGASDDRALWPEMCRVIEESRPRWVLGENVPGIINMELDRVLSDLESLGYSCWPLVLPACAVDARHRRDRVWIVANAKSGQSGQPSEWQGRESAGGRSANLGGSADSRLETPADAASGGRNERHPNSRRNGEGTSAPKEWSGLTDHHRWPAESGFCRVADGIPNRSHRLKGLGNAIVPQLAATILATMVRMENEKVSDPRRA